VTTAERAWTTRRLLAWMGEAFSAKGLDSPRLCAEILLAHVIGCDRLRLYMEADRPASPLERSELRDLVRRALEHEPVQYLTGEAWFFGLPFHVDRRVLIPRPATETIVEQVLQHARSRFGHAGETGEGLLIGDVCTGSGCVAIALARRLPEARLIATDASEEALEVARRNRARHQVVERVELIRGDLLAPLREHPIAGRDRALTYLVANPPYIPDREWEDVDANVRLHEPEMALRGGTDGLDFVRPLAEEGPDLVAPGGLILIEVAASASEEARALVEAHRRVHHAEVAFDHEGLARVVVGHVAD
jgi:release factor glutamine methyltransferase